MAIYLKMQKNGGKRMITVAFRSAPGAQPCDRAVELKKRLMSNWLTGDVIRRMYGLNTAAELFDVVLQKEEVRNSFQQSKYKADDKVLKEIID